MADIVPMQSELFIHLDLDGLLALMKAAEAAIATGCGRLELGSGSGITAGTGAAPFAKVILTFTDAGGGGGLALAA